jgi:hypothetical protein
MHLSHGQGAVLCGIYTCRLNRVLLNDSPNRFAKWPRPFGFDPLSIRRQKSKYTAQGGVFAFGTPSGVRTLDTLNSWKELLCASNSKESSLETKYLQ